MSSYQTVDVSTVEGLKKLRQTAEKIDITTEKGREEAKKIAEILLQVVDETGGSAGYAAPQIEVEQKGSYKQLLKQVIAIKIFDNRTTQLVLVNPEIIYKQGSSTEEEGCFSVDKEGQYIWTFKKRPYRMVVKGYDIEGNELIIPLAVPDAMIFKHEYEHLFGELIIDDLSFGIKAVNVGGGEIAIGGTNTDLPLEAYELTPEERGIKPGEDKPVTIYGLNEKGKTVELERDTFEYDGPRIQDALVRFTTERPGKGQPEESTKYGWKQAHPERKSLREDKRYDARKRLYSIF